MAKTMHITTQEGAANALAINRDASQVVIAGRNVFKIYSIEDEEFVERMNLRVGKNINLNYSCADVVWHPAEDNILATAATNGAVVTWDLNKTSRSKQDMVFQQHKRTVNKVSFHPTEPYTLLSGSQDGTMKNFDLRKKDVASTFYSNSESVRDVQFSPHQYFMFAAVQENGNVQLWDLRRTDKCERQFTGHNGPVFACDWHPDEKKWLATAGRDKTIKVWDLSFRSNLDFTIQTIASVARIKWRPQRKYHIACTSLVLDFSVNVWDVRRPFIPFASFVEHRDVTTGIVWRHSSHLFLSTGKDSTLYQHAFKDADRPADRANPMGLDINCSGEIVLACGNRILTDSFTGKQNNKTMPAFFRKTPTLGELFPSSISSCIIFDDKDKVLSLDWAVASAERYLLTGKPFDEICEHNAMVAADLNRHAEAQSWRILKLLYGTSSTVPPPPPPPPAAPDPPALIIVNGAVPPDGDKGQGQSSLEPTQGKDIQSNDQKVARKSGSDTGRKQGSHQKTVRQRGGGKNRHQSGSDGLMGDTSTGFSEEDTETDETEQWGMLTNIASGLAASIHDDFWYGDGDYDERLFRDYEEPIYEEEDPDKYKLSYEAFTPRHELNLTHTPPPDLCLATFSSRRLAGKEASEHVAPVVTDDHTPLDVRPETLIMPAWDYTPLVVDLLYHYAAQGDVQMCVSVLIILGDRLKAGVIDELTQEQWYTSYIDLLTRFQLWNVATEVIKLSPLPSVNTMNQQSTSVHTNCNMCSRHLQFSGWMCDRCKKTTNPCSVCHLVVKGLYVWCQGCCHGGHLEHMRDWFEGSPWCPTGCGHLCQYT